MVPLRERLSPDVLERLALKLRSVGSPKQAVEHDEASTRVLVAIVASERSRRCGAALSELPPLVGFALTKVTRLALELEEAGLIEPARRSLRTVHPRAARVATDAGRRAVHKMTGGAL